MKPRRAATIVLVVAGAAGLFLALRPHTHAPFFPQFRRQVSDKLYAAAVSGTRADPRGMALVVTPPTPPKPDVNPGVAAYQAAIAANAAHPGARAFRADTDVFCDLNKNEVEAKARKEGISVAEVRELTYFGFLAMRTTQAQTVEHALGRQLSPEELKTLDQILAQENESFTRTLRELVDEGASADKRWQAIQGYEQYYTDRFAQSFGMTDAQFDQMLAPDPAAAPGPRVPMPPHQTPPPEPPRPPPPPPDPNVPPKPVVPPLAPAKPPTNPGPGTPPPPPGPAH